MLRIRSKKSVAWALLALAVLTTCMIWFLRSVQADEPAGEGKVYAYVRIAPPESLFPDNSNPMHSDKALEIMKRNALTVVKGQPNLGEVLRKDQIRGLAI